MNKFKVILHSSVSLDGSLLGFAVDMNTHYQIVGSYKADVHLIGSNTARAGLEMFCPQIPEETAEDFSRPERNPKLPLWVIPDTRGQMLGLLHILRRFELCRDILIVISRDTPEEYADYLRRRDYTCYVVEKSVDYGELFKFLAEEYKAKKILTDTGKILNCILLNGGLVDEVSLLVHPVIVGRKQYTLLSEVADNIALNLIKNEAMGQDKVWMIYRVIRAD
jgi:2,5-diamino-6-(ribosylamino)-4(3H)-pyrimidinone 5'-phosphate reductase